LVDHFTFVDANEQLGSERIEDVCVLMSFLGSCADRKCFIDGAAEV